MKPQLLFRAALLMAFAWCVAPALAKDVYVIAHSALSASEADIKEIYTGEKQISGGVKVLPTDNAAVQADFQAKVIKMEGNKYNAMWTKKSFRDGVAVPPVKGGDAEVAAYVKSTPGAVGYVSAPVEGVKVLGKY